MVLFVAHDGVQALLPAEGVVRKVEQARRAAREAWMGPIVACCYALLSFVIILFKNIICELISHGNAWCISKVCGFANRMV